MYVITVAIIMWSQHIIITIIIIIIIISIIIISIIIIIIIKYRVQNLNLIFL